MGVLVCDFFLASAQAPDANAGAESDRVDSALLVGPAACGKTTLLFYYAINLVAKKGYSSVVIICKRRSIEDDPPSLPEGVDTQCLRKISFKYVSDDEELDKYFAAFHLSDPVPQAVMIDNFSGLFEEWIYENNEGDQAMEVAMVDSLALALDAMEYASSKTGLVPKLVISDIEDEAAAYMYIYRKYMSKVFVIKRMELSRFSLSDESRKNLAYVHYSFGGGPVQVDEISPMMQNW